MAGLVVQLQLLGLLVLVLIEIAATVANANHIVRFASGINNNDTLRKYWSRPESIIFCPVRVPILLSWVLALGVHAIVHSIMVGFLQIVDAIGSARDLSLTGEYTILLAANGSSAMAAMALYITCAGAFPAYQILGTIAVTLCASLAKVLERSNISFGVLALWICISCAGTVLLGWWVSQSIKNRTPTTVVRQLTPDRSKITPPQTAKPFVVAILCFFLLFALRIGDELLIAYIKSKQYEDIYLAQVLRNFGGLMVLIGCSFVAIRLVNVRLGRMPIDWQWISIGVPPLVLNACEVIIIAVKLIIGSKARSGLHTSPAEVYYVVMKLIGRTAMYGVAGFLGSAVYLAVLARAAMNALDPGFEGQSELILDDDDSEYELEP